MCSKIQYTGAQMLDAIYQMGFNTRKSVFGGLRTTKVRLAKAQASLSKCAAW